MPSTPVPSSYLSRDYRSREHSALGGTRQPAHRSQLTAVQTDLERVLRPLRVAYEGVSYDLLSRSRMAALARICELLYPRNCCHFASELTSGTCNHLASLEPEELSGVVALGLGHNFPPWLNQLATNSANLSARISGAADWLMQWGPRRIRSHAK